MKTYALYKDDEFIDLGTAKELAKSQNVKVSSIQFLKTPTYKKRIKDKSNAKILIEIED